MRVCIFIEWRVRGVEFEEAAADRLFAFHMKSNPLNY